MTRNQARNMILMLIVQSTVNKHSMLMLEGSGGMRQENFEE